MEGGWRLKENIASDGKANIFPDLGNSLRKLEDFYINLFIESTQ